MSTSTASRDGPCSLGQMWCQGRSLLTRSTRGVGRGAGQLLVDGCRCGQLQVGCVHTGQGKDLAKQGEEVCILARRLSLQSEASGGQGREESLEADTKPVGQVKGRPATSSQVAAGLFGQHGLCPGLGAGEAEATS